MEVIATHIDNDAITIKLADNAEDLKRWIEIRFPIDALPDPYEKGQPLTDIEAKYVAEIRLSALRAARDVIGEHMRRIQDRAGPRR